MKHTGGDGMWRCGWGVCVKGDGVWRSVGGEIHGRGDWCGGRPSWW